MASPFTHRGRRREVTRGARVAGIALLVSGCGSPARVEIAGAPAPATSATAHPAPADSLAGPDLAMPGCVVSESRSPAVTADQPQTLRAAARSLRDGAGYQAVRRIDRTHALVRQRDGDVLTVFVVERTDFGWYAYTALINPAICPQMQAEFEQAADPSFRPTDG